MDQNEQDKISVQNKRIEVEKAKKVELENKAREKEIEGIRKTVREMFER